LDCPVALVVEEVVEVGVDLCPQGILQVEEGVDRLLRLFLLRYIHMHFLLHCLPQDCLFLLAVVEGAVDLHLV
jgi:hypothetical protein